MVWRSGAAEGAGSRAGLKQCSALPQFSRLQNGGGESPSFPPAMPNKWAEWWHSSFVEQLKDFVSECPGSNPHSASHR